MKRLFTESSIEQMTRFIQSNKLSPDISGDNELKNLSINVLRLMSSENVHFLSLYYRELDEKEATEALKQLGFEPNIPLKEKRDLLKGVIKTNITDIVKVNIKLVGKDNAFEDAYKDDGFQQYREIIDKTTKKRVQKYSNVFKIKNKKVRKRKIEEYFSSNRRINGFINLYDMNDFEYQLSERNLPSLKEKDQSRPGEEADPAEPVGPRLPAGRKPRKTREVSIYDKIDNTNVILRKKKILKLEPSGHIDYHVDCKFKLKSIRKKVDALASIKFDLETYKAFDLRAFIEDILYINNGITPPRNSNFQSIEDFKNKAKSKTYFFSTILCKYIERLLMKQDKYLSYTDAKMLAEEVRNNLLMKDIEYFYNIYFDSGYYYAD